MVYKTYSCPSIRLQYHNEAVISNQQEGVRISRIVKDGKLLDSVDGIKTVHEAFYRNVERAPDSRFLGHHKEPTDPYEWMTYKQAYESALDCGSGLLQLDGISEGKFVGIYATNCPEWIVTEFGCWEYGIVVVPLYDTLGVASLKHICQQTQLNVIVCDTPTRARRLLKNQESLTHLKTIVVLFPNEEIDALQLESNNGIDIIPYQDLLARGRLDRKTPIEMEEDSLIIVCYTSGTTGTPKGAMILSSTILSNVAGCFALLGPKFFTSDDVHLSFLPLAHIYEQFVEIYVMLSGAGIGFFSGNIMNLKFDMQALKPTLFTAVPRLLYRIYDAVYDKLSKSSWKKRALDWAISNKLKQVDQEKYAQDSLVDKLILSKIREQFGGRIRIVLISSAPISTNVLRFSRAVFSCPILEGYGCTECCGPMTMSVAGDMMGGHVGAPLPSIEVKLVDVAEMNLVASRDQRGEICCRGRSCIRGYYKAPDKTAELIDAEGWMHTGDIGIWDKNCLKIVDRCKNIFKLSQGEYIAPEKIEQAYAQSPYVNQVFVDGDALCNHPVAIVFPEQDAVKSALNPATKNSPQLANGDVKSKDFADLCKTADIKMLILDDFKRIDVTADLKGFEKVKNIHLITEPFTVDNGMLTPTLKTARPVIRKFYAEELAQLYK